MVKAAPILPKTNANAALRLVLMLEAIDPTAQVNSVPYIISNVGN